MRTIGVYVHFPFCLEKCPYCDFVSYATPREAIDHAGYATAVLRELQTRAADLEGAVLASVFFGGGTPSLWEPVELGRVLRAIQATLPPSGSVEVTVECNPSSLDEGRAAALLREGVTRLSVGVQGLDGARLRFLGRLHSGPGGLQAVRAARAAGVPEVSGDLLHAVPGQTATEAAAEAEAVVEAGATHLSAYCLTVEPGTRFGELARRGSLPLAAEEEAVASYLAIEELLLARGFRHYEISNYARPGSESRHNLGYWTGRDYLGLGCAAHGTLSGAGGGAVRYRNEPHPARYVAAAARLAAGEPLPSSGLEGTRERLDAETRLRERIMLGLRLEEGFDAARAARELGVDPLPPRRARAARRLVDEGRLVVEGGRWRIPRPAWLYADGTSAALF